MASEKPQAPAGAYDYWVGSHWNIWRTETRDGDKQFWRRLDVERSGDLMEALRAYRRLTGRGEARGVHKYIFKQWLDEYIDTFYNVRVRLR